MPPRKILFDPQDLARARALYESGTGAAEIGRLLGVCAQTVRNRAAEFGWSRARLAGAAAPDDRWPAPPPPVPEPEEADLLPGAMLARLTRLTAREMLRAEAWNHPPDAAARTLAMLSRAVGNLLILYERLGPGADGDEPLDAAARDRAEFESVAWVVARFCELYEQEGPDKLLDRARRFMPPLLPLAEMVVRDRERSANPSS